MPEARLQILSFSPFDSNLGVQIAITIHREADTIRLLRAGPFTRLAPLCQVI
jgi:hypothetical protein